MLPPSAPSAEARFAGRVKLKSSRVGFPLDRMNLTEEYIAQKLHEAIEAAGPSTDGYAEIDLNDETHLKCAAVLVPLVWEAEEWHLLFTRRTERVESHKGQVSFPGGGCDDGETTPEQTALREVVAHRHANWAG